MSADLIERMDFYYTMVESGSFTRSALSIGFVLLFRHMNGHTGPCDPSTATLADETSLTVRGVEKAIAELRASGWWEIKQGRGRGCTNSYAPDLKRANASSGFKHRNDEQPFRVSGTKHRTAGRKTPNSSSDEPVKNQNQIARYARSEGASSDFETFWRIYPHRGDFSDPKKPAGAKFAAAVRRGVDPAEIIAGAERYRAHVESLGTEPRFRPQAQTWLNQERWNDQLGAPEPLRLRVGMN
jgi:hypothetical protein